MKKLLYSFASSGELRFYFSLIGLALMLSLGVISLMAAILVIVACIAQAQPSQGPDPASAPISGTLLFILGLLIGSLYLSNIGQIIKGRFETLHNHRKNYLKHSRS